jgi:hypothetical protein
MKRICAGIQRPLQLKSFSFWVFKGLCDPEYCGIIPQSRIYYLGSLNNEPYTRHTLLHQINVDHVFCHAAVLLGMFLSITAPLV